MSPPSQTSDPREMFEHLPFPFHDERFPPQLGAVVQRTVINGQEPAREVIHTDDNSWLVGDGLNDPNPPGAAIAFHLSHLLEADPTLEELATLPLGCVATRSGLGQPWAIGPHTWASEA